MKSTVSLGIETGARKARSKARRAVAASQQSRAGCSQAPRPGADPSGSGTTRPLTLAKRRNLACGARSRQPTRVRPAPPRAVSGSGADAVGVLVGERLVGVQAAVARARQGGVRAAPAVAEDRRAAAAGLLLFAVAGVLLLLGELGLGPDAHAPAGEPRGEPRVLALAPDGQRELVVRHDHRRLLVGVVHQDLAHAGGAEGLGDEAGGLVVVGDDVDLLAAQLGHDHPHARAARAHAGAD